MWLFNGLNNNGGMNEGNAYHYGAEARAPRERGHSFFNLYNVIKGGVVACIGFLVVQNGSEGFRLKSLSLIGRVVRPIIPSSFDHCPPTSLSSSFCKITSMISSRSNGDRVLWEAKDGDLDRMCSAIANCENIDARDRQGKSALYHAIVKGDRKKVEALIYHGVDLQDDSLAEAALSNHRFDIFKLLVDIGAAVPKHALKYLRWERIYKQDFSVEANLELLRYLLTKGKDIDLNQAAEANGKTPLMVAIKENSSQLFEFLSQHGADMNAVGFDTDSRGLSVKPDLIGNKTPLFEAVKIGSLDWVRAVVDAGGTLNENSHLLMLAAVWSHSVEVMEYLIENGPLSHLEKIRESSLIISQAVKAGNARMVSKLIEYGAPVSANPNSRVQEGSIVWNIFYLAAHSGSVETLQLILARASMPLDTIVDQFSVLKAAARSTSISMIRYFIEERKLDPKMAFPEDGHRYTSLLYDAAEKGNLEVVKYLVEVCNVDIHARSGDYNINAHSAARLGRHEEIENYLSDKGVQSEDLEEVRADLAALYDPFGRRYG